MKLQLDTNVDICMSEEDWPLPEGNKEAKAKAAIEQYRIRHTFALCSFWKTLIDRLSPPPALVAPLPSLTKNNTSPSFLPQFFVAARARAFPFFWVSYIPTHDYTRMHLLLSVSPLSIHSMARLGLSLQHHVFNLIHLALEFNHLPLHPPMCGGHIVLVLRIYMFLVAAAEQTVARACGSRTQLV